MGENLPEIGERVTWHTDEGEIVFATVVRVYFWDLVDLELAQGVVIRGVRRVIDTTGIPDVGDLVSVIGRFQRMK